MMDLKFPETRWTIVRNAGDGRNVEAARKAFQKLCKDYWPPLYAYARAIGLCQAEATDLVNELFYRITWELFPVHHPEEPMPEIPAGQRPVGKRKGTGNDKPLLERAQDYSEQNREEYGEEAGRLRDFLMLQLKAIARTNWRTKKRQSKDGDVFLVEDAGLFEHEMRDDLKSMQTLYSPDEVSRRVWRIQLVGKSRRSLRASMHAGGQVERFEILWPLIDRTEVDGTLKEAAAKISEAEGKVLTLDGAKSALSRMKSAFRREILTEIARTLPNATEAGIDEEYRALFA